MFTIMTRRASTSSCSSTSSSISGSPTPSLSPSGWNPSRPTISPATVTPLTPSPPVAVTPELDYFSTPGSTSSKRSGLEPLILHPFDLSSSSYRQCAFPSWPARASLAPEMTASPNSYGFSSDADLFPASHVPSSRISDEDLESLDLSCATTKRHGDDHRTVDICVDDDSASDAGLGISWSDVGNGNVPSVATRLPERRRRLPPPPSVQVRRRSSSRGIKRKMRAITLCAIAE